MPALLRGLFDPAPKTPKQDSLRGPARSADPFGPLKPDPRVAAFRSAWARNRAQPLGGLLGGDPFRLDAPVGRRGANRRPDVLKLETLLDRTGDFDAGAAGGPTGFPGSRLDTALKGFQTRHGLKPDGLVEP